MSIVKVLGSSDILFSLGVREVNLQDPERTLTGEACLFATSEE